jgi:hypothetical protein
LRSDLFKSSVRQLYQDLLPPTEVDLGERWPERHVAHPTGEPGAVPQPFHTGQDAAWESGRRLVAMVAGTKGGKTSFDPWWLWREILTRGGGDYLAITATYDLFKFKLLPALRQCFEHILGVGRWWAGDRVLELKDPRTGEFLARQADDIMYGRIIMRSADALGGLESGDARAAVLDEAGLYSIDAWRAINRRLALHQGRSLITTTLYDLGFVDSEIIEKAQTGGETTVIQEDGAELEITDNEEVDICLVQFDSTLNPVYPKSEYEKAERDLPDDEFQAFHRGRRVALRTLIYDSFKPGSRRHVRKRFRIPKTWRRWVGHDFGGPNMVAVFYAQKPGTNILYCYRIYETPSLPIRQHVEGLKEGEPGLPHRAVGGASGEEQWRDEFDDAGWPIDQPEISNFWLGINQVYAAHRQFRIVYFDDLRDIIADKKKYRRKKDRQGNVVNIVHNKPAFHRMDAERYVVSEFMIGGTDWENLEGLGQVEDFESRWT